MAAPRRAPPHGVHAPCKLLAYGRDAGKTLTPPAYYKWSGGLPLDELCSTAVPSPSLTMNSPPRSPGSSVDENYAVQSHVVTPDIDGFTLPDAEGSMGCNPEFTLAGGNTLRSLLTEYFLGERQKGTGISAAEVAGPPPPPGLEEYALNPGIQASPPSDTPASFPSDTAGSGTPMPASAKPPARAARPVPNYGPSPGFDFNPQALHLQVAKQFAYQEQHSEDNTCGVPPPKSNLPSWCTTAMLRNIPNKYTRDMLTVRLHEDGFKYDLDFLYMPVDFKHKCNMGYAFVNFRTPEACARFAAEYHLSDSRTKLPGFRSGKVCEVSTARCQGREENVQRLLGSPVMAQLMEIEKPEWLPVVFNFRGECSPVCRPGPIPRMAQLVPAKSAQR